MACLKLCVLVLHGTPLIHHRLQPGLQHPNIIHRRLLIVRRLPRGGSDRAFLGLPGRLELPYHLLVCQLPEFRGLTPSDLASVKEGSGVLHGIVSLPCVGHLFHSGRRSAPSHNDEASRRALEHDDGEDRSR